MFLLMVGLTFSMSFTFFWEFTSWFILMKPVLYAIAPSHLNLYSFLLIITVVYGLLFISFYYHYTFSFFLFQEILFARLIASLSGWYLSFWFHTFLFLCFLVSMYHGKYDILFTWFLVCFIFRIAAWSFIILLTLWKFSWKFEDMYFVCS